MECSFQPFFPDQDLFSTLKGNGIKLDRNYFDVDIRVFKLLRKFSDRKEYKITE